MVATFRGVDWGGQAGPFKRVNVRSHPSAHARWEWGDRCRHSVKKSGRTVQLTAVRETSRNDGRWRCWDGGLQTPENSSFGYFTDFILILQIYFLFYRFDFTDFNFILQILFWFYRFYFAVFILHILFYILLYRFYFLFYRFDFTDLFLILVFILKIITDIELYCSEYSATTTTKSGKNHSRIFQF